MGIFEHSKNSCSISKTKHEPENEHDFLEKKKSKKGKPEIPSTTTTTGCVCQRPNLLTERKRREEGEQERKRRREDDSELLTGFRSADKVRALLLSGPLFLKISVLPPRLFSHLCLHVWSLINFSVTIWQEFKCRGYSCQKPKRQICEKVPGVNCSCAHCFVINNLLCCNTDSVIPSEDDAQDIINVLFVIFNNHALCICWEPGESTSF